ncbi:poly(U)-specific endoribonuclease-B-like [Saccoglossus kowalevskii]
MVIEEGITGIHNWIRYYMLEKSGQIGYRGIAGRQCPSNDKQIMNIQWKFGDTIVRPQGSTIVGSTPGFDIALYTAAFMAGCKEGHSYIRMGSHNIDLYCQTNMPNGDSVLTISFVVED